MKRIFISQPMGGKIKEEILHNRNKAILNINEKLDGEFYIIDSIFENIPQGINPLFLLGKSIELLSTADIAYFVNSWQNYKGCRIEHQCAVEYGIEIIEESNLM